MSFGDYLCFPRSRVAKNYLRSKLLNQKVLISKFRNNISVMVRNNFNRDEISYIVLNPFDIPDFYTKMVRVSTQFPETALFVKGQIDGYCLLEWENKAILKAVRSGEFFQELLYWNNGPFEFEDLNLLQRN